MECTKLKCDSVQPSHEIVIWNYIVSVCKHKSTVVYIWKCLLVAATSDLANMVNLKTTCMNDGLLVEAAVMGISALSCCKLKKTLTMNHSKF